MSKKKNWLSEESNWINYFLLLSYAQWKHSKIVKKALIVPKKN